MNEIIASILDAEKRADEIVKLSAEKAKAIKQSAEEEGEKVKNSAVAVFRLHRAAELKAAEERAAAEYDAVISEGKSEAEILLKKSSEKTESYSDEILKGIIG